MSSIESKVKSLTDKQGQDTYWVFETRLHTLQYRKSRNQTKFLEIAIGPIFGKYRKLPQEV